MKKIINLLVIFFLFSGLTCYKDVVIEEIPVVSIDPDLQEYVDRFYNEATLRGKTFSKENLEVVFKDIGYKYCGYGYPNYPGSPGLRRVEIDTNPNCWEERSDIERENLMFHELGHAILNRSHLSNFLPNGLSKSIMCSSDFCNGWDYYNQYTIGTRPYYLDELFDVNTAIPDWAEENTNETLVFKDNFELPDSNWVFLAAPEDSDTKFTHQIIHSDRGEDSYAVITSNASIGNENFVGWRYDLLNPIFKEGGTLRLSMNISGTAIAGNGIAVVLRTDSGPDETRELSAFSTTQGQNLITGNFENLQYSTEIGYFPSDVSRIAIFLLMLDRTRGEVQLNNVELVYLE